MTKSDIGKNFEEIYFYVRKKFKEESKNKEKINHRNDSWIINFISVKPSWAMFIAFGTCLFLELCVIILASFYINNLILQIVFLTIAMLFEVSILLILVISSHQEISCSWLWQLQAEEIRKKWLAENGTIETLKKAVKLRIFYYEQRKKSFMGLIAAFTLFIGIVGFLFSSSKIHSLLYNASFSFEVFFTLFLILATTFFISLEVPLQWRRQVGFCILEDI